MPVQCLDFNSHNPLEAMECFLSQGGPEDENEVYFGSKLFKLCPVPPLYRARIQFAKMRPGCVRFAIKMQRL